VPDPTPTAALERVGHVLLLTPLTFSYHEAICTALRNLGHEVTWWNDRASDSAAYKIALRILPNLTKRASAKYYEDLLDNLELSAITDVLIVKGEGLSRAVIATIRDRLPNATMGLYLWDGIENVPGVLNSVGLFDAVSTFDPEDAAEQGWHFRPLFARNAAVCPQPPVPTRFDWCFIGTLHSDRHRVITALLQRTIEGKSFVFGYLPGNLVFALRHLTDWRLWRAPKGSLSTTPMSAVDIAAVVGQSRAVLDVEHPRQRGLTMRTIETLLAGKKLLTTNRLIMKSDLFDPSRVEVIDRRKPAITAAFLGQPFKPVPHEVAVGYSCVAWIGELLLHQRQARSAALALRSDGTLAK
jgi:hypothetical protein